MYEHIIKKKTAEFEYALTSGQSEKANTLASQMAKHYEQLGDASRASFWERRLTWSLYYQGRYAEASFHAERAIEFQPDESNLAMAWLALSSMKTLTGDYYSAFNGLGRTEEIVRHLRKESHLKASMHMCKGFIYHTIGDLDAALVEEKTAAEWFLQTGNLAYAAALFNNIGFYLAKSHQVTKALPELFNAIDLVRKEHYLYPYAGIYDSLGFVYTLTGQFSDAENYLIECINTFHKLQNKVMAAGSLIHLSQLYDRMRRWKQARREAERALQLATEINSESLGTEARNQLDSIEAIIVKNLDRPRFFHEILYVSNQMQRVVSKLEKIAPTDEVVLILGETGTGKELAARAIHRESRRSNKTFIPFNCSALSRELIESRLFGHRRGAFTSADRDQQGVIRAAEGGTIFLDEIGDLSLEAQGALLRFLQTGEVQPVGASVPFKINVRVIAATNRDLLEEVEAGRFRRDLYYRLNIVTILMPPLRLRREDIRALARHFAGLYSKQYSLPVVELPRADLSRLSAYDWPGNVRELEGVIKRRVLLGPESLAVEFARICNPLSWRRLQEAEKRKLLLEALESAGGNVTAAARQLGLSRRAVQKILQRMKEQVS